VVAQLSTLSATTLERATATIAVTAEGRVPSGIVTVYVGSSVLHTQLTDGKASVVLPGLAAGSYPVAAMYGGDDAVGSQSVLVGTLTVTKAVPSAKATLAKKKIKTSTKPAVRVKVAHPDLAGPTGKVQVKIVKGSKTVATKTVTLAKRNAGSITVRLPKVAAGKYRVTASYRGSAQLAAKSAKSVTLTVVK
jgi:hypothetical protein